MGGLSRFVTLTRYWRRVFTLSFLAMDYPAFPDSPGSINPAAKAPGTFRVPVPPISPELQTPSESSVQSSLPTAPTPTALASAIPHLSRISSEWDSEDDIASTGDLKYQDFRCEFEQYFVEKTARPAPRAKYVSHRGWFRRQTLAGASAHIPLDPEAGPDTSVVIDGATESIYDAYLLRVDIMKNINDFHRHQVSRSPRV